jgi:hypothetical protein
MDLDRSKKRKKMQTGLLQTWSRWNLNRSKKLWGKPHEIDFVGDN